MCVCVCVCVLISDISAAVSLSAALQATEWTGSLVLFARATRSSTRHYLLLSHLHRSLFIAEDEEIIGGAR